VDVSERPDKLEEIKLNGFQQLPVVTLDEHFENAWSGYNLDRLEELKESC
jgi:glutaredoxin